MASVKTSGTQTASIGTEHTLATITDAGTYQLILNCGNAVADDILEARIYLKTLTGSTITVGSAVGLTEVQTLVVHAPAAPVMRSVPILSLFEAVFTIKQVAGTGRSFPWGIWVP